MSRTTRRRPYGFNPGEPRHQRAVEEHVEGCRWNDVNRNDLFNNRDSKSFGEGKRGAYAGGPKGYSSWDSLAYSHRRYHSRAAARIIRARGKDEIRQELLAD